jgi:large subunit ribosomal protein L4
MKWPVKNLQNEVVGEIDLQDQIFGQEARPDILHRVVTWQLAKARAGTHQTKTISMISGTTKKPYRQKGTGRARQGSLRSPQFRGGAVVLGPQSRDHGYSLPKKVRRFGLQNALSTKRGEGQLIIVDSLKFKEGKTKDLALLLKKNGWESALFIDGTDLDLNFALASANIPQIDVLPQQGANVYSILRRNILVLSKDAVHHLEARLK